MSTKTSIKRVALIAVSALGFGLMALTPSTASELGTGVTQSQGLDTANAVVAVGGNGTFTFDPAAAATFYVTYSGLTVVSHSVSDGVADTVSITDGSSNITTGGSTFVAANGAGDTFSVVVTSAVAGAGTITIKTVDANTGIAVTVSTTKVTFSSVAAYVDLASIQVSLIPGSANADCTVANKAAATHNSIKYEDSDDTTAAAAADDIDLCVIALSGAGTAKTGVNISVAGNGKGSVNGAAVASSAADAQGIEIFDITGNGLSGVGTFDVTVTSANADGTTTTTKTASASVTFFGEITTITLSNVKNSIDTNGGAAAGVIQFACADENAVSVACGTVNSAAELIVDSDYASTTTIDAAGEEDAEAAVATPNIAAGNAGQGTSSVSALGVATKGNIDVTPSAGKYEMLLVSMQLTNGNGVKVTSNVVTLYVSDDVAVAPTVTVEDGVAGASQTVSATVNADITGKTYPVADGETVTFATSGGALSASTATTKNGLASVTLFNSAIAGDYTLTATADSLQGKKTYAITGGIGNSVDAATEAAVEATDAANQAYEAAVVATETAEAAVAAAEDAKAAAEAATAAVEALATQVSTMMAELKAQVTALAKTVAKILKRV